MGELKNRSVSNSRGKITKQKTFHDTERGLTIKMRTWNRENNPERSYILITQHFLPERYLNDNHDTQDSGFELEEHMSNEMDVLMKIGKIDELCQLEYFVFTMMGYQPREIRQEMKRSDIKEIGDRLLENLLK